LLKPQTTQRTLGGFSPSANILSRIFIKDLAASSILLLPSLISITTQLPSSSSITASISSPLIPL